MVRLADVTAGQSSDHRALSVSSRVTTYCMYYILFGI